MLFKDDFKSSSREETMGKFYGHRIPLLRTRLWTELLALPCHYDLPQAHNIRYDKKIPISDMYLICDLKNKC